MLSFTSVLALAASVTALALPQTETTGNVPDLPYATNTTVYYYTGTTSSSDCGYEVGNNTLQANVCNKITTQGLSIQQVLNGDCTYTLWSESTSCDSDDKQVISIPNGTDQTCIYTGVLDGGKHYLGSGIWTCG